MKKIFIMITLLSFIGCDTVVDEYLYDSGDDEFSHLQAMAAQQCIDDASIFTALDTTGSFETSGLEGKVYSITQDTLTATTLYMKISAVTATAMTVQVNSSGSTYDKVITFEKTDHDALLTELKIMSCSLLYSANFSASSLSSTESMTLTWNKESISVPDDDEDEDDEPEAYQRRTDTLTFSAAYPLFFYFYNGSKVATSKDQTTDEKTGTSKIVIKDVTGTDICDENVDEDTDIQFDDNCNFEAATTVLFPACEVVINSEQYKTNNHDDSIFSLSGTDCNILTSAQI